MASVTIERLLQMLNAVVRQSSRKQLGLSAAGLAALTIVLRFALSKESKLIHDLRKVGKPADSKESPDEYDFIIVGGGIFFLCYGRH